MSNLGKLLDDTSEASEADTDEELFTDSKGRGKRAKPSRGHRSESDDDLMSAAVSPEHKPTKPPLGSKSDRSKAKAKIRMPSASEDETDDDLASRASRHNKGQKPPRDGHRRRSSKKKDKPAPSDEEADSDEELFGKAKAVGRRVDDDESTDDFGDDAFAGLGVRREETDDDEEDEEQEETDEDDLETLPASEKGGATSSRPTKRQSRDTTATTTEYRFKRGSDNSAVKRHSEASADNDNLGPGLGLGLGLGLAPSIVRKRNSFSSDLSLDIDGFQKQGPEPARGTGTTASPNHSGHGFDFTAGFAPQLKIDSAFEAHGSAFSPLGDTRDEDVELENWKVLNSENLLLRQAIAQQAECVGLAPNTHRTRDEQAQILRLIVHYLQARGKMDLCLAIRREAQEKNIHLMLNADVTLAGKDKRNPEEHTELYHKFRDCLYYLPPMDPTWANAAPWPTDNYRKYTVPITTSAGVPLPVLIDHLLLDRANVNDYPFKPPIRDSFTQAFFVMHPEFVNMNTLLTLFGRFYLNIPDALLYTEKGASTRLRVLKVLTYWIRYATVDFSERLLLKARSLARIVLRRLQKGGSQEVVEAAEGFLQVVDQVFAMGTPRVMASEKVPVPDHELPDPKLEEGWDPSKVLSSIWNLNEEEVARQVCLLGHEDFSRIRIREFYSKAWDRGNDLWSLSSNLRTTIARLSNFVDWVASQIIAQPTPEDRRSAIRQFVRIAWHTMDLKSFACAQAIHSGVSHRAIKRMKQTVPQGPEGVLSTTAADNKKSEVAMWDDLEILSGIFNPLEIKKLVSDVVAGTEACTPLLALPQKHFTVCHDRGDSYTVAEADKPLSPAERDMLITVNWGKMLEMSTNANMLLTLQSRSFNFKVVPQIRKVLEDLPGLCPGEVLDKESLLKEPPPPRLVKPAAATVHEPVAAVTDYEYAEEAKPDKFWRRIFKDRRNSKP